MKRIRAVVVVCDRGRQLAIANDGNQQTFVVATAFGCYGLGQCLSIEFHERPRQLSNVALQVPAETF